MSDGQVHFQRIALIGIGLIGSSLAHVIRRDGLAGHIAVGDINSAHCAKALELGIADSAGEDAAEAARDADLVIICAPIGAYASIAADRRRIGQPIGHADCQIAAIARSVGTAVATRDAGGFRDCGIEVIDPWLA